MYPTRGRAFERPCAVACASLFLIVSFSVLLSTPASAQIPDVLPGQMYYFHDATEGDRSVPLPGFTDSGFNVGGNWAGAAATCNIPSCPIGFRAWAWVGKTVHTPTAYRFSVRMKGYYSVWLAADGLFVWADAWFYIRAWDLTDGKVAGEMVVGRETVFIFGMKQVYKEFDKCFEFDAKAGHLYNLQVYVEVEVKALHWFGRASVDALTMGNRIHYGEISIADYRTQPCYPRKPGCPWINTWDGSEFQPDNNILWMDYSEGDSDYYTLRNDWQPISGNNYTFKVDELGGNISQIDKIELITVDHDTNVNVTVDPNGNILTYASTLAPAVVLDNNGIDRRDEVLHWDNSSFEGNETDFLTIDFGPIGPHSEATLITVMRPKPIPVGDGGATMVQVYDSGGGAKSYGSDQNTKDGSWIDVGSIYPRADDSMLTFNLTPYLSVSNSLIRLELTSYKLVDYVGLVVTREEDVVKTTHNISWANHSKFGDATDTIAHEDQKYQELYPGDELVVSFILPPKQKEIRDFILVIYGYTEDFWAR